MRTLNIEAISSYLESKGEVLEWFEEVSSENFSEDGYGDDELELIYLASLMGEIYVKNVTMDPKEENEHIRQIVRGALFGFLISIRDFYHQQDPPMETLNIGNVALLLGEIYEKVEEDYKKDPEAESPLDNFDQRIMSSKHTIDDLTRITRQFGPQICPNNSLMPAFHFGVEVAGVVMHAMVRDEEIGQESEDMLENVERLLREGF